MVRGRWSTTGPTGLLLLATLTVSGCGHHPSGSVDGEYRIVGGPPPGINHPLEGTIWAFRGKVSWDQAMHSTPVAHVTTDSAGRFDLRLPVGEFTLLGSQGRNSSLGGDGCGGSVVVEVQASTSRTADVVCDVP